MLRHQSFGWCCSNLASASHSFRTSVAGSVLDPAGSGQSSDSWTTHCTTELAKVVSASTRVSVPALALRPVLAMMTAGERLLTSAMMTAGERLALAQLRKYRPLSAGPSDAE